MNFKHEIDKIFDFDISEEIYRDNIITEGVIEKAKELAKKAMSVGIEKVLPSDWLSFAKGLFAAAKQGSEEVFEFLENADPEKVQLLGKVIQSGAVQSIEEDISKNNTIEEGEVASELITRSQDISDAISNGAGYASTFTSIALCIITLALSYGFYKIIVKPIIQTANAIKKNKRRRR